jgi:hypothetical protein
MLILHSCHSIGQNHQASYMYLEHTNYMAVLVVVGQANMEE